MKVPKCAKCGGTDEWDTAKKECAVCGSKMPPSVDGKTPPTVKNLASAPMFQKK